MKKGFTIIELLIVMSIIAVLIALGISAYSQGRDRQSGKAAGERIMSILSDNQKKANIGDKNCVGRFKGQKVTFTPPNIIQEQSLCTTSDENPLPPQIIIDGITSLSSQSFTFKPISSGIDMGASSTTTLNYTSSTGRVYSIRVNNTGTFEYLGTP